MSDFKSQLPKGGRGGMTRVTQDGVQTDHDKVDQKFKPDELMAGPIATVGISASVGQSTDYARAKYEISAWCSLPVPADDDSIRDGYDVAYDYVMSELQRRESDVQERFFPELVSSNVAKKEG